MVKHRVGDLKHCPELYPRLQIDPEHVQRMVDALEAKIEMPPIIVCRRTLRMVDGNHRAAALKKRFGDDEEVACIEKDYKNDAAFFLDAIKWNGTHGLVLTPRDRQRSMEIAGELHIDPKRYAEAMCMTSEAATTLSRRIIVDAKVTSATTKPFKQNGRPVFNPGKKRADFISRLDGVMRFLELDFDPADEEVVGRFRKLLELITKALAGDRKEAGAGRPTFRKLGRGVAVGDVLERSN